MMEWETGVQDFRGGVLIVAKVEELKQSEAQTSQFLSFVQVIHIDIGDGGT